MMLSAYYLLSTLSLICPEQSSIEPILRTGSMALNDRQLKILKVIDQGNITGDDIVNALGSSMQMTSYYLTTMADDGYLKIAKVYDNATREFLVVRAYLTDQGKDALLKLGGSASPESNEPASLATNDSADKTRSDVAGSDAAPQEIDYSHLAQAIANFKSQLSIVPEVRRELIEVYLEDLQNEVNVAYRRKLVRIKAYFLAILNATSPILKQLPDADQLRSSLETIGRLIGLSIQLPG